MKNREITYKTKHMEAVYFETDLTKLSIVFLLVFNEFSAFKENLKRFVDHKDGKPKNEANKENFNVFVLDHCQKCFVHLSVTPGCTRSKINILIITVFHKNIRTKALHTWAMTIQFFCQFCVHPACIS